MVCVQLVGVCVQVVVVCSAENNHLSMLGHMSNQIQFWSDA